MATSVIQIEKATVVNETETHYELSVPDLFNDINESLSVGVVQDKDIIKGIKTYAECTGDDRILAQLVLTLFNMLEKSAKSTGELDPMCVAALRCGKQAIKYLAE